MTVKPDKERKRDKVYKNYLNLVSTVLYLLVLCLISTIPVLATMPDSGNLLIPSTSEKIPVIHPVPVITSSPVSDQSPGLIAGRIKQQVSFSPETGPGQSEDKQGSIKGIEIFVETDKVSVESVGESYEFVRSWGEYGSGDTQFDNPLDVAVDNTGNVYVTDKNNYCIKKFNNTGHFLEKWEISPPPAGWSPFLWGISVDSSDNVYVADYSPNSLIMKFNSTGTYLTTFGGTQGSGDGEFDFPSGVAVDSDGNIFVADQNNYRIQKLDGGGNFLLKWGTGGTVPGEFDFPRNLDIDSAGNVFVADNFNHRIQKFNSTGDFLTQWGGFTFPEDVAVDMNDNVYVADTCNNRIQKFDNMGNFITEWGSTGSGDGQFNHPYGLTVDNAGYVYVADTSNDRIQVFKPTPPPTTIFVAPKSSSHQINTKKNYTVTLSDLTEGLGSFDIDINLTKPAIAQITNVYILEDFVVPGASGHSAVPAGSVNCWAMTHVPPGSQNLNILTVTIKALSAGKTNLTIQRADLWPEYTPTIFPSVIQLTMAPPTISTITPNYGYPTENWPVIITGTNFREGSIVKINKGAVFKTATIQSRTPTKIEATLPIIGIATGSYNLTIKNSDGTFKTKYNAFLVKAAGPKPTIKKITPNSGLSTSNTKVTITGTNFRADAMVQMVKGSVIKKATIQSRTATNIICVLPTKDAPSGLWDIKITNTDKTKVTKTKAFTVTKGSVTLTEESIQVDDKQIVMDRATQFASAETHQSIGGLNPVSAPVIDHLVH